MKNDEFDKLFKYMAKGFDDVNKKLDTKASQASVDLFINSTDTLVGEVQTFKAEQAVRDAQWSRLLEWAKEVSKKTGVPLPDM